MYRLVFLDREATRPPLTGDAGVVTIGRAPDCQVQLPAAGVHDRHAVVERRPTGYHIRDLTGQRGVRVNGRAVADQRLRSGDEIELGAVRCRFEVIHPPPPPGRAWDVWQVLAAVAVTGLLIGQIGLLAWVFAQPHPRDMKTDIAKSRQARRAGTSAASVASPVLAEAPPPPLTPATPPPGATVPAVPLPAAATLPRALRILKVERMDEAQQTAVRVQVRAQVGERQFDAAAAGVTVEFLDRDGRVIGVVRPELPARWENLTSRQFTARWPAAAETVGGVAVRTYYRQQLQDQWVVPRE